MDRISQLPDELLLRILSFRPNTKDVVATMVLSKRWKFLWKSVPKLVYDDGYQNIESRKFTKLVYNSFFAHEAPLDTLHFKLGQESHIYGIAMWITIASHRCVRELIMEMDFTSSVGPLVLPMRLLYAGCKILETLKLNNVILVDDSDMPSFPKLKTLSLLSVKYHGGGESVKRLLSSCHVLEDLAVERCLHDNVTIFTVEVPSLKSLVLSTSEDRDSYDEDGFVVDAPSLKYLEIRDHSGVYCVIENIMPDIVTAKVDVSYSLPWKILRSITSVKDLYLCLSTSTNAYHAGSVFQWLVRLKLCTCEKRWLNLLMRLLRDSPNLQALKLERCHTRLADQPLPRWREQRSVPECVKSSLETLEWVGYEGPKEEKELVAFILRSGRCLKKATIIPHESIESDKEKLEMIKELSLSSRSSPTCQLQFD